MLALSMGGAVAAQTALQVVSRNIQQSTAWKPGMELIVNGEKAEVTVVPTDSTRVFVTAELSARHPNADTAQADAAKWQFTVQTVGKKIYIRSYVGVAVGQPVPVSGMKARIAIRAPRNCSLNLYNKFGRAQLQHLDGHVVLSGEFCRFQLSELSGELHIDSQYGTIEGQNLHGKIDIRTRRADIALESTSADCAIRSEYGSIRMAASPETGNVRIEADKTDVTIRTADALTHNYRLQSKYGQVFAPPFFDTTGATPSEGRAVFSDVNARALIDVQTSFGVIRIEK